MSARLEAASAGKWPVWGHRSAVETLSQAIAVDRVRHAYVIAGVEGVGKTTLALAFARALCCQDPVAAGIPCGNCRSCRKIERGVHPDVQVWGIESQAALASKKGGQNTTLTIETVRAMTASAALRPIESRWRVLIVDDAELMQEATQEALLKTLEEPPSFTVILLLANEAELLLSTVRSRCQTIELSPLSRAEIDVGLRTAGTSPDEAAILAGAASGLPGWAIRASRQPKLLAERLEGIDQVVRWVIATPFERMVTAVKLGDSFAKRRQAVFHELEITLGLWRDTLLMKAGLSEAAGFPAAIARLEPLITKLSFAAIYSALCSVRQCIADLEANVRPRLALESMVLQWPTLSAR